MLETISAGRQPCNEKWSTGCGIILEDDYPLLKLSVVAGSYPRRLDELSYRGAVGHSRPLAWEWPPSASSKPQSVILHVKIGAPALD